MIHDSLCLKSSTSQPVPSWVTYYSDILTPWTISILILVSCKKGLKYITITSEEHHTIIDNLNAPLCKGSCRF